MAVLVNYKMVMLFFIFENEGYCEECFNAIAEERFFGMSTRELADWLGADVKYIGEE